MNKYELAKMKQEPVTSIYGENESVLGKALKNLAENEYFSGQVDRSLWDNVVVAGLGDKDKLPPALSEDGSLHLNIMNHPMFYAVLDLYCQLRGKEILAEAQVHGDAELKAEIKRVREVQKLYAKPDSSGRTLKYVLALLIVILMAILLGGN